MRGRITDLKLGGRPDQARIVGERNDLDCGGHIVNGGRQEEANVALH